MFNYYQETATVQEVIDEIVYGRIHEQEFGWNGTYNKPTELKIDTLEILKNLIPYEIPLQNVIDKSDDFCIEDYIEHIFGYCGEAIYNNTSNDNLPLSNHIETAYFNNTGNDTYIMCLKVHLKGDVRGCYSPWMIFRLTCQDHYTAIASCEKRIPISYEEFEGVIIVNPNYYGWDVYMDSDDSHIEFTSYEEDIESIIEEFKEKMSE